MENTKKVYEALDVFVYLWKRRKPIIVMTVIGAIFSIITVLLIKNEYMSTTIMFPTKYASLPLMTFQSGSGSLEVDPMIIGGEGELERMIEILSSDEVVFYMIKKYNLIEHYNINPNDKAVRSKVEKEFRKRVSVEKTKYMAAKIDVIDEDPVLATHIANDMVSVYDSLYSQMQKERATDYYNIIENAFNEQQNIVYRIQDSLDFYRKKGIIHYYSDVDRFNEAYWKSLGKGTMTNSARIEFEQKKEVLIKYGKVVRELEKLLDASTSTLVDLKLRLLRAKINLNSNYSRKFVVEPATVPDKKYRPQRSMIVVSSTIGSFVLAIALMLLFDLVKEIVKNIKKSE